MHLLIRQDVIRVYICLQYVFFIYSIYALIKRENNTNISVLLNSQRIQGDLKFVLTKRWKSHYFSNAKYSKHPVHKYDIYCNYYTIIIIYSIFIAFCRLYVYGLLSLFVRILYWRDFKELLLYTINSLVI